ncbi:ATP-binding protein [Rosistilla oblonga]|uniref:ATP-binding protein n=1 Tax=Rosistilla oblonga TaxID=2527990 RepID=UPI003A98767E
MRKGSEQAQQLELLFPEDLPQLITVDDMFERPETLLEHIKEDRRFERKSARKQPKDLGEYFSMWANTSPNGGILAVGIEDDGTVSGCKHLNEKQLNALESTGESYCPEARYSSKRVAVGDNFVVIFRIHYHQSRVVRTASGGAYRRVADAKVQLKNGQLRELEISKGEVQFERDETSLRYPEDFDLDAIRKWATNVKSKMGWSYDQTDEKTMSLRHLGTTCGPAFVPNNACVLLFAKDPRLAFPGARVYFMRFDGEEERTGEQRNTTKEVFVEGQVPEVIHKVEEILESQLRTFSKLYPDGKFYTTQEYPKSAWYEAVVNACVHRSYSLRNMQVFVKMFDDRLEVISPGDFPPCVTPENVYSVQHSRNPVLMDAMWHLGIVKMANEGTKRMRDTMAAMALPEPIFERKELGSATVQVTLRNNIKQRKVWVDGDVTKIIGEALAAQLSEREKRIVNWMAEHGDITVNKSQLVLQTYWQDAKNVLHELSRKRILQYIRFKSLSRDTRDQKAFFRLRSSDPIPQGAHEELLD